MTVEEIESAIKALLTTSTTAANELEDMIKNKKHSVAYSALAIDTLKASAPLLDALRQLRQDAKATWG